MTRTVLLTGGTGTVGRELLSRLAEQPSVRTRVASRDPDRARETLEVDAGGVDLVAFSYTRPETWGRAIEGVDGLFLVYPPRVGVAPIRRFLDAAHRVGVGQVVFLSVLGADRLPVLPHRRIETHLEATGMDTTFLRAAYFMQNLGGIHRPEILERAAIFVPAGDGRLGMIDARDVAAVAALALVEPEHRNAAYDLTGPESLDFHAVAAAFEDVLDREITYTAPSVPAFARRMYARGVEPGLIAFMVGEYLVARLGLSGRTTDTVASLLGRPPRTIRDYVADHRSTFEQS